MGLRDLVALEQQRVARGRVDARAQQRRDGIRLRAALMGEGPSSRKARLSEFAGHKNAGFVH